jgi:hypothetical protein
MDTKLCIKCNNIYPITEFYTASKNKDKLSSWCKQCHRISSKISNKKWETNHLEELKVIRRIYARKYYKQHADIIRQKKQQWYKDNYDIFKLTKNKYIASHKKQIRAQMIANKIYFIQEPCEVKGCLNKAERHHPNYDRPKSIVWLCRKHHKAMHVLMNDNPNLRWYESLSKLD